MTDVKKQMILQKVNNFSIKELKDLIDKKGFDVEDFIEAGLDPYKIDEIKRKEEEERKRKEEEERKHKEEEERRRNQEEGKQAKQKILNDIISGKVGADEIKVLLKKDNIISIQDIENLEISPRIKKALVNYLESNSIIESFLIDELPPMELSRTDIYCIGLAGTGKTTMLTGLLKTAHQQGRLISDTYAGNHGINYQTTIISNLKKGFIPSRTATNSYMYVPISIQDDKEVTHPLNIVDVPGEIFKNINETGDADGFLKYMNNDNKKIFFIVIDAMTHNNFDHDTLDQSLIYPNILQILKSEGVAEHIDGIYLVVNKFDHLMENEYLTDDREEGDIAREYVEEHFKALITSCKDVRKNSRYDFKIRTMPFSIGSLKWGSILENFDKKYSETLLEILINDSFVIKGGTPGIFK